VILLVNEAVMAGIDSIQIGYPFLGLDLMTLNPDEFVISDVISFDRYAECTPQVDPAISREIPGFSEMKHALISAGVMELTGWDETKKELLRISEEPQNVHTSRRKTYVTVDTNILYFRVVSRRMNPPSSLCIHHGVVDPRELSWVISDVVVNEIDKRIRDKYRKEHIEMLKRLNSGHLAERLMNMSTLSTRTAKCAFLDLHEILGRLGAFRIRCREFPENKEERDILIARTLRMFEEERDCDILLLSADEDMLFHARDNGISCYVLHVPHVTVDWARLTPETCAHLIRDLAVTYGCISLKGTGIVVYGEWTGMTSSNWMNEDLMLWVEEGARILPPLKRSLKVSRAIRSRFPREGMH
jgi:hypothetical protein